MGDLTLGTVVGTVGWKERPGRRCAGSHYYTNY